MIEGQRAVPIHAYDPFYTGDGGGQLTRCRWWRCTLLPSEHPTEEEINLPWWRRLLAGLAMRRGV